MDSSVAKIFYLHVLVRDEEGVIRINSNDKYVSTRPLSTVNGICMLYRSYTLSSTSHSDFELNILDIVKRMGQTYLSNDIDSTGLKIYIFSNIRTKCILIVSYFNWQYILLSTIF